MTRFSSRIDSPGGSFHYLIPDILLLMDRKSGDHHLGCMKPVVNNGIFTISTDAGFLPSTV